VVLTPRRWRQARQAIDERRWQQSPVTGESTKEAVKTIARGMPGQSGEPVVTMLVVLYFFFARETAGATAPGIPCALFCRGKGFRSTRALIAQ
jgi:hypothetical protein